MSCLRFSIIITNYNNARYLRRCVDSALNQDYENYEVIVVDDGSSDDSVNVIKSYSQRIVTIIKNNGGQSSAINQGFATCTGDIICFLDADDTFLPHCLSSIANEWKPEYASLHFAYEVIDSEDRVIDRSAYFRREIPSGDLLHLVLRNGGIYHAQTTANAFARHFLENVLPMAEVRWELSVDSYLCFLAPFYGRIGHIPDILCQWRKHSTNNSSNWHPGTGLRVESIREEIQNRIRLRAAVTGEAEKHGLCITAEPLEQSPWFLKQVAKLQKMDPAARIDLKEIKEYSFLDTTGALCRLVLVKPRMSIKLKLTYLFWVATVLVVPRRFAGRLIALTP